MKNEFELAFNEIAEARMLAPDVVLEALQTALISAYRRDANASAAQRVDARIDPGTGRARIFVEKEVVDDVQNPNTEVELEKARYYDPEAEYGDMVMVQVEGTTKKFGRIAAQTAKQVILQKIREAERNALYEEYVTKEGDVLSGQVQSVNAAFATLSLNGRAEAMLPRAQQIPGERYKPGDKVRTYVLEVKKSTRGPQIIVSRSHRNMLKRLLEFEVPEIYNGQVEIKNIAREAGGRSKVAVAALQDGIDPVGACVGMRGIRIQNIVKELHDEKIDVIEWNPDQEAFIAKALSPARVTGVYLEDDPDLGRTAVVIVPDDQLSLAIGREGQNARLAAKLTGWRIDIKSVTEAVTTAMEQLDIPPMMDVTTKHPDMMADVVRIMEKKTSGLTVMPEDYTLLSKFADVVERRMMQVRDEARQARLAEINAVKSTLPQEVFKIPVDKLDLPDRLIEALQPLENVGEIMLRFLIDENRLRRLLGNQSDQALAQVQESLDQLVMPEDMLDDVLDEVSEEASELVTEVEAESADEVTEAVAVEPETQVEAETEPTLEEAAAEQAAPVDVFPDEQLEEEEEEPVRKAKPATKATPPKPVAPVVEDTSDDDEFDDDEFDDDDDDDDDEYDETGKSKRKKKKERQQRRQLIFDEDLGEVVVKRRRKGSRKREDWDDYK